MRHIGEGCKYPNIKAWMQENRMGYREIADAIDFSFAAVCKALSGKSNCGKDIIDGLLKVTGLTYEEAFWLPEGEKC